MGVCVLLSSCTDDRTRLRYLGRFSSLGVFLLFTCLKKNVCEWLLFRGTDLRQNLIRKPSLDFNVLWFSCLRLSSVVITRMRQPSLGYSVRFYVTSKFSLYIFIYFFILRACVGMHIVESVWRSEDNLCKLVFSFYHVCLRDWTQIIQIGSKCLCPLSHLVSSKKFSFLLFFWWCWRVDPGFKNVRQVLCHCASSWCQMLI